MKELMRIEGLKMYFGGLKAIDEKLAKVAELKETINSSKATVTCPVCGKECSRDAFYCSQCGHKL